MAQSIENKTYIKSTTTTTTTITTTTTATTATTTTTNAHIYSRKPVIMAKGSRSPYNFPSVSNLNLSNDLKKLETYEFDVFSANQVTLL